MLQLSKGTKRLGTVLAGLYVLTGLMGFAAVGYIGYKVYSVLSLFVG